MTAQIFILLHILAVLVIACTALGIYLYAIKEDLPKKKKWPIIGIVCGVLLAIVITTLLVFWESAMHGAPARPGEPDNSMIVAIIVGVVLIVFGVLLAAIVKLTKKKAANQSEIETKNEDQEETDAQTKQSRLFTTKNITRMAVLTAIAIMLYLIPFLSPSIPILFPDFLSLNFSDIPVLLTGFMMGPIAGVIVLVAKIILKLPFTSTAGVGELGDLMFGLAFMLPAAIIYMFMKNRKGAIIGLVLGIVSCLAVAILANRFILIPFYMQLGFFGGDLNNLVNALSALPWHTNITYETFWRYYLLFVVVPFNLLRLLIAAAVTFILYKHLSRASKHLFDR